MECDKAEPYLLGFDNVPRHSAAQSNAPKYLEHSVEVQSGRPVAPLSRMEMARYGATAIEPVLERSTRADPSPVFSGQAIGRALRIAQEKQLNGMETTKPFAPDQGSVLASVTTGELDAPVNQGCGLEAPPAHSWVIASFENGMRFQHDPRPFTETGLWTWTCSACGFTERSISSVDPPTHSPSCVSRSTRRGKISERDGVW